MITHEKATDKNIITKQVVINTPTSARLLPITADKKVIDEIQQALNELEELKSWRDELNGIIQDLISKAKHWEEKENKTDFEKGIARGYKTMLHQLLVGIDFDKEIENDKKIKN